MKKSKGFTLIEVMIVIAIVGILVAVAIPGIQKMNTTQTVEMENCRQVDTPTRKYWECDK